MDCLTEAVMSKVNTAIDNATIETTNNAGSSTQAPTRLPPSNGLAAVAARIQERANALASERAELELLQAELEEANSTLESETITNSIVRKSYLTAVRTRHGLELDVLRLQDECNELTQSTNIAREQVDEISNTTEEIKERWNKAITNSYAPHGIRKELYKRRIEGRVRRRQEKRRKRERKLDNLALKAHSYAEEAESMHREREKLREEIREMDEREEREDEEIAALDMQIKSTLAKVELSITLTYKVNIEYFYVLLSDTHFKSAKAYILT
mmetsp:Transcript_1523/g.2044  ORF Transcript_1523/g.2044 Transcript_1523/m.2044 type:complete len:271 (+) Transcript_1523:109-921(+)